MKRFIIIFALAILDIAGVATANAQTIDNYITVSGRVADSRNGEGLKYANITVAGTNIGTVTNEDGAFTIKIDDSRRNGSLLVSRIGFFSRTVQLAGESVVDLTIELSSNSIVMDEVTVLGYDPRALIEAALERVSDNYDNANCRITGFYRETVSKRRQFINVAEAVVDIYKTPYNQNTYRDRVAVLKSRGIISFKTSDTLSVKLQGGPNLPSQVDAVKDRSEFFSKQRLDNYDFVLEAPATIDKRTQIVISFKPSVVLLDEIQYEGRLFIDEKTLAFTRIEYNFDMSDPDKVTRAILVHKPASLRFKPLEVAMVVTYKEHDGRFRLNYILTSMQFKCDWKRRLFSTNYHVTSETVATDSRTEGVEIIPYKASFKQSQSLSESVENFSDDDFWGAYNIIEPTESLENAIGKLKKQQ